MIEWSEIKLGEIADLINGYAFKSKDFTQSGIPVIKIKNVKPQLIKLDELSYVHESTVIGKEKWKIKQGDILITMSGNRSDGSPDSWVGKVAQFNKEGTYYLNQRVSIIKPNVGYVNPKFLAYLLSSWDYQLEFINQANSSGGQANISPEIVKSLTLILPPLPEQERIAEVLSSLDDKIDLLQRQNKTLEEMAETLFRQWFVEELEDGWSISKLKDLGKVVTGKTPSTNNNNFWGRGTPFITPTDFKYFGKYVTSNERELTNEGVMSIKNMLLPKNSILVTCIGSDMGKVAIATEACITNQQINSFVKKPSFHSNEYVYQFLKSIYPILRNMALGGTTMPIINKTEFENIEIPIPSGNKLLKFEYFTDELNSKLIINSRQIQHLETLRDTLLPKLMSGEVRVKN